jgi:SAM-dependent methyltransferase
MKDFWNERYRQETFAYGELPNEYLKEQLRKLEVGNILFAAEGEGRNAVFAAQLGWEVSAFDISEEGQKKAQYLAKTKNVKIDYWIGDLATLRYEKNQFDAIALIFAHFPAALKSSYHKIIDMYLRSGGTIIFEAFSKEHVSYVARNEKVGGPRDVNILFSMEELRTDFPNYEIVELVKKEVLLNEGAFHNGLGSVIRFVGKKK